MTNALIVGVVSFFVSFYFADEIFMLLIAPFQWGAGTIDVDFIFDSPMSAFFVNVKIAILGAVFVTLPMIVMQIYKMIAPDLYKNERSSALPFLFATTILHVTASCVVYFLLMPIAARLLLSGILIDGNNNIGSQFLMSAESYLNSFMILFIIFSIIFQLPTIVWILSKNAQKKSEAPPLSR